MKHAVLCALSVASIVISGCGGSNSPSPDPARDAAAAADFVASTVNTLHGSSAAVASKFAGYWEGTVEFGDRRYAVSAVATQAGMVIFSGAAMVLSELSVQNGRHVGILNIGSRADTEPARRLAFSGVAEPGRFDGLLMPVGWTYADVVAGRQPATTEEAAAIGRIDMTRRTPPVAMAEVPRGVIATDSSSDTRLNVDPNGNLTGTVMGCTVDGAVMMARSVSGVAEVAATVRGTTSQCRGLSVVTGVAQAATDSLAVTLTDGRRSMTVALPRAQ